MRFLSLFMVKASFHNTRLFSNANANSNTNTKCTDCLYYEPREHPFTNGLSKCRRFGERDSESGRITYEYADLCRKNEQKCGQAAKYFEQKNKE